MGRGFMRCLIYVLMVLIWLAPAYADGPGWVLWGQGIGVLKTPKVHSLTDWVIYGAYETIRECNTERAAYLTVLLQGADVEKKEGKIVDFMFEGGSVTRKMPNGNTSTISEKQTYYCLPGTLDPREKK
jgi:hypothetical protein